VDENKYFLTKILEIQCLFAIKHFLYTFNPYKKYHMSQITLSKRDQFIGMGIVGFLFFIFGFVTWVNGSLIAYLKIACELSTSQAYLVTFAFFIAYTVMAIPSSIVLKATGFKKGMSLGLVIMALGALLFVPAAQSRTYSLFLSGLFIIATGLTILQTAANPYVSIIGPIESAAQRISIMGVFNKIGGQIAIFLFGFVALKNSDALVESLKTMDVATKSIELNQLASRVITPYLILSCILLVAAIIIWFSPLPNLDDNLEKADTSNEKDRTSIFSYPYVWLGALAIFMYVGVEVVAGDTIALYGKAQGISLDTSKYYSMITLGCMLIGYLVGIVFIPKLISQQNALFISGVLGLILSICVLAFPSTVSVYSVGFLGLANAVMWPAIFPLAIDKLGKFTKLGSALLIMGISGGAILPLIYGVFSEAEKGANATIIASTSQHAYWILIPAYLYILWYGFKGHTIGKSTEKNFGIELK
jgi:MFS transporter, FHS family, L-fucose permease